MAESVMTYKFAAQLVSIYHCRDRVFLHVWVDVPLPKLRTATARDRLWKRHVPRPSLTLVERNKIVPFRSRARFIYDMTKNHFGIPINYKRFSYRVCHPKLIHPKLISDRKSEGNFQDWEVV